MNTKVITSIVIILILIIGASIIIMNIRKNHNQNNKATSTAAIDQPSNTNTTPSTTNDTNTLKVKDIQAGTGAEAKNGDSLAVEYTGKLTNGTVFDSTDNHGGQPFSFTLGAGEVIPGWDQGLVGMKVGGTRELTIPASLGYGNQAQGSIPANSTLIFTVKLDSIN